MVRECVRRGEYPMASILVAQHGKVKLSESCGVQDVASGAALASDSIFHIYSMTKPITCAAAMVLYERGCFHLEDPVSAYLPEFGQQRVVKPALLAANIEAARDGLTTRMAPLPTPKEALKMETMPLPVDAQVTILHLFTHTAGLHNGNTAPNARNLDEYSTATAALPLLFLPGTRFRYGEGISILGRLIEVWSGRSYGEFIQAEVLNPLGMFDTSFALPPQKRDRLVKQYKVTADNQQGMGTSFAEYKFSPPLHEGVSYSGALYPQPSGGLVSTVTDYFTFAQMLLNGGRAPT